MNGIRMPKKKELAHNNRYLKVLTLIHEGWHLSLAWPDTPPSNHKRCGLASQTHIRYPSTHRSWGSVPIPKGCGYIVSVAAFFEITKNSWSMSSCVCPKDTKVSICFEVLWADRTYRESVDVYFVERATFNKVICKCNESCIPIFCLKLAQLE